MEYLTEHPHSPSAALTFVTCGELYILLKCAETEPFQRNFNWDLAPGERKTHCLHTASRVAVLLRWLPWRHCNRNHFYNTTYAALQLHGAESVAETTGIFSKYTSTSRKLQNVLIRRNRMTWNGLCLWIISRIHRFLYSLLQGSTTVSSVVSSEVSGSTAWLGPGAELQWWQLFSMYLTTLVVHALLAFFASGVCSVQLQTRVHSRGYYHYTKSFALLLFITWRAEAQVRCFYYVGHHTLCMDLNVNICNRDLTGCMHQIYAVILKWLYKRWVWSKTVCGVSYASWIHAACLGEHHFTGTDALMLKIICLACNATNSGPALVYNWTLVKNTTTCMCFLCVQKMHGSLEKTRVGASC